MQFDLEDTIVASASAPGGAARGIVRVSGPAAHEICSRCFSIAESGREGLRTLPAQGPACILSGVVVVDGADIPAALHWRPTTRTYTRQPLAEFHLPGSPPLLQGVVDALCQAGARPARPGEFTLRAFLAGRIDLTQAEAVLGVIDARGAGDLDAALAQLAGGLSRPLTQLRTDLLDLLAELEAGLDFAEEEIAFIAADELATRLADARRAVDAVLAQLSARGDAHAAPRVVLVGPPNVGKSSLFNALAERYGVGVVAPAIVADQSGTTRDYLSATLVISGVEVELIDTAGEHADVAAGIDAAAQQATALQRSAADVWLECRDEPLPTLSPGGGGEAAVIRVITKCDRQSETKRAEIAGAAGWPVLVSSHTGEGIARLAASIVRAAAGREETGAAVVAATAVRTGDSLRRASASLAAAADLAGQESAEDLLAAEVRAALSALGEVVGAVYVDDVLDRVFSNFCIGK